ncbi:hypothetical protein [Usitatibacter palustris]|uniref:DUF1761 domain-containing protein n=1 Tax=Usitatibacter palustris TaxID=2732487 RepID=A0A6M4H8R8_9PROT|nr:hypothetical protein [Usitatibacter palustris]QJR15113.1 hypothetical protein DSM104440_01930 [Usitatibacter palustris]
MVTLTQLWLPILLSAVAVFVASSLIHTVIKWHQSDYFKLGNEDDVRAVIRAGGARPGLYVIPHVLEGADCAKPEVLARFTEGPVGFLTLRPVGPPNIVKPLIQWFSLVLLIAIAVAALAAWTLPKNASFMTVTTIVGAITFLAYACGGPINGIWMGKPWRSAFKEILDGFVYAAATALVFAWLWPRG